MCIHICTYICIYTVSPRPKSTVLLTTVTKRSVKNAKCVPSLRSCNEKGEFAIWLTQFLQEILSDVYLLFHRMFPVCVEESLP